MNGVESASYVGQCMCRCQEISHWLARLRSGTREESYLHSVSSRARTLVPTRVVYFKREHVNQLQVVMSRRGNHSYLSSAWVSLQHSRLDESWQVSIFPSCSTLRYKPFTANSEARTRDTGRTHVTGHQEQERVGSPITLHSDICFALFLSHHVAVKRSDTSPGFAPQDQDPCYGPHFQCQAPSLPRAP